MTVPRPQAPGAKPSEPDPAVDWRVRSQVLEEAIAKAERLIDGFRPEEARDVLRAALSLGLPDEERGAGLMEYTVIVAADCAAVFTVQAGSASEAREKARSLRIEEGDKFDGWQIRPKSRVRVQLCEPADV